MSGYNDAVPPTISPTVGSLLLTTSPFSDEMLALLNLVFLLLPAALSFLSLWVPLLVSVKALQLATPVHLQFLLTYWLVYACKCQLKSAVDTVIGIPKLDYLLELLMVWMFYGRGCTVVSAYYVPAMSQSALGISSVEQLENSALDPFVLQYIAHNSVVEYAIWLLPRQLAEPMLIFTRELRKSTSTHQSLLLFALDFFCSPELPELLHSRYRRTSRFFGSLALAVKNLPDSMQAPPGSERKVSGARAQSRASSAGEKSRACSMGDVRSLRVRPDQNELPLAGAL